MSLYLGIDGGGVKTTAIAANEHGKILSKTVGGSIDYKTIGVSAARNNLKAIVFDLTSKIRELGFRFSGLINRIFASFFCLNNRGIFKIKVSNKF